MIVISHRGNLKGSNPSEENGLDYIDKALTNYDVEIDLRIKNKKFFLGHDLPQYPVEEEWLFERRSRLWIHAKDFESLSYLNNSFKNGIDFNFFWHQEDHYSVTSAGYIWAYPGYKGDFQTIAVLPEQADILTKSFLGVCTDYPTRYIND
jgi:hypothetical protein|tara:strand:+ start:2957 stop:3406 length:450 start_codon:yes stop_codon:yes gene_type:complete